MALYHRTNPHITINIISSRSYNFQFIRLIHVLPKITQGNLGYYYSIYIYIINTLYIMYIIMKSKTILALLFAKY